MRGSSSDLTAPSVVQTGENAFNAFYLFKTENVAGGWSPFTAPDPGAVHSPQDLSATGSGLAVRVPIMSAFSKVSVVCCTWGGGNTGLMTASGYVWNTDYATTIKQTPLWTKEMEYQDNSRRKSRLTEYSIRPASI